MSSEKTNVVNFQKFLRANLGIISVFILIILVTHMDANAAMIIGEITALYASILLFLIIYRTIAYLVRSTSEKSRTLKKTCVHFFYIIILCAGSWHGISYIHDKIDTRFQPVIEKLESFKAVKGIYPEKLEDVVEHSPACVGLNAQAIYHRNDRGNAYTISCMTMGFNHHEYSSIDHKWHDWD